MEALLALADCAAAISGNIHTLHLNIVGEDFDTMHKKVLKKYYEQLDEDYDSYAEWARCFEMYAPNKNESASRVQFQSIDARPYSRDEAIEIVDSNMQELIKQMHLLFTLMEAKSEEDPRATGVANFLQTRIEYWTKEIFFFNKARGTIYEHI